MRLSKRCEYGIKAAVHLAQRQTSGYTQSREIAECESLPAKFLESILLALRSAAILESKVGAGGGYRLARPAEDIRVLELITLLDPSDSQPPNHRGPAAATNRAAATDPAPANLSNGPSAIDIVNTRLDEAVNKSLGQLDLATLASLTAHTGGQNPQFESRIVCC